MISHPKKSRIVLLLALAFRIAIALRFSYLHPDEHLQGPQEIAHGMFGWASQVPWEFRSESPVRSFVPLCLIYGIPMGFFDSATQPVYVLYTLRIMFMTLTWVLEDMAIDRLAPTKNDKLRCLLFVSTSYATLTWQAHTLSNSFETILLLWFLVILVEAESVTAAPSLSLFGHHYDSCLLGLITVLGVFNRPTFLAFLLIPSLSLLKLWYRFPTTFVTFAVSASVFLAGCIYVDTLLYGKHDGWVITPWNFIKYNTATKNLTEHGLHSRFTHLLVNLPLLMGPGLLMMKPRWLSLPMQSALSALALLSLIPHQEARFLLPLVPLLCCQMDLSQFKSSRAKKLLLNTWFAFNVVMGVFMGFLHQAGVIPAQVHSRELDRPATVIWWKTYTPPLWVSGLQSAQVDYLSLSSLGQTLPEITSKVSNPQPGDVLTVVDLQGAPVDTVQKVLQVADPKRPLYMVTPFAKYHDMRDILHSDPELVWKTKFHLDPELIDLRRMSSFNIGLGVYNLTSAPPPPVRGYFG